MVVIMNNPAAFPRPFSGTTQYAQDGMTLRDYFAAKAMQAKDFTVRPYDTTDETAKDCYRMADAMLKAREA
jgi:hypothetical protein